MNCCCSACGLTPSPSPKERGCLLCRSLVFQKRTSADPNFYNANLSREGFSPLLWRGVGGEAILSLWHNHPSTNEAPLPHHAPRTLLILPEKRYCRHTRNHRLLIHEPMRNHIYKEPLHRHATHGSFLRQEKRVL